MRNFTAHDIMVYAAGSATYNEKIRKWILKDPSMLPIAMIPTVGLLNVQYSEADRDSMQWTQSYDAGRVEIPVRDRWISHMDDVPEGNDYLIVSYQYKVAAKEMCPEHVNRLRTVGEQVCDASGKIVGVLNFFA